MSRLIDLILVHILVLASIADKLVRMDVSFKMTGVNTVYPQPVVNFKADGQIWKQWYENSHEDCKEFLFGCYECNPPCKQGPTKTVDFVGGARIQLFPHTGKLDFNDGVSTSLDFGLVAAFNRELTSIWASLGLAPSDTETAPYRSVPEQLLLKKVITESSYAIYFNAGANPSGELILGGDDPSKRAGALNYLKIVDAESHFVRVLGLAIGSDPKNTILIGMPAVLDTGASHIIMDEKFKRQVIAFLQTAGAKKVQIEEKGVNFVISCADAPNLPSMTFLMEGLKGEKIPLLINAASLVQKVRRNVCYMRIAFKDYEDAIFLGASAFLGRYLYFDLGNTKIGFANV
ncbi:hypothetical protein FOL47_009467 [Perkinsus chesapeaki]|uniref:Peptidase A1 domain-containing protein n=1 Tax=Perkinsus chesapeaki TaxID=330153 RepID=A0A7J6L843_PERCH|nr:hypothetical protein FOL47_009467 [Perkinsus chesapeaki]